MPKSSRRTFALSRAYVEMLHDTLVTQLMPGDEPIGPDEYRDRGLLSSATGRPFQTAFGQELHKSVFEKGAALFHSLISNHPFRNGNKRTAVMALDLFMLVNGYLLTLDNNEMYDLAKFTATYREKGIDHDTVRNSLAGILKRETISFRRLKKEPGLLQLYRGTTEIRRLVRNHELNKQQPGG